MIDERLTIVAIRRSLGYICWVRPLHVYIDGEWVGKVWENRTREFPATPGEHLVTVMLSPQCVAGLPVSLQDYDRVELICTTDAVQPHPWQIHSFLYFLIFSFVLYPLGVLIPPIRAFMDKLVVELLIALGMGWFGMTVYFWRIHKAGAWRRRPAICLTFAEQSPEEQP